MGGTKNLCPIYQETSLVELDAGTLVRQRSPNAGPICFCHTLSHQHRPVAVNTLLFDEDQLVAFGRQLWPAYPAPCAK
jgi:hypothetical protein